MTAVNNLLPHSHILCFFSFAYVHARGRVCTQRFIATRFALCFYFNMI
jgi:hypothetical protein